MSVRKERIAKLRDAVKGMEEALRKGDVSSSSSKRKRDDPPEQAETSKMQAGSVVARHPATQHGGEKPKFMSGLARLMQSRPMLPERRFSLIMNQEEVFKIIEDINRPEGWGAPFGTVDNRGEGAQRLWTIRIGTETWQSPSYLKEQEDEKKAKEAEKKAVENAKEMAKVQNARGQQDKRKKPEAPSLGRLRQIPRGPSIVCGNVWCNNKVGHHIRSCVMPNKFGFISGCFVCNQDHSPAECDIAKDLVNQMPTNVEIPAMFLAVFFEDRRRKPPLEMRNILTMARQMPMAEYTLVEWRWAIVDLVNEVRGCGLVWTLEFAKSMRNSDAVKDFDYSNGSVTGMPIDPLTLDGAALMSQEDSKFEISPAMAQKARKVVVEEQGAGKGEVAEQSKGGKGEDDVNMGNGGASSSGTPREAANGGPISIDEELEILRAEVAEFNALRLQRASRRS